MDPLYYIKSLIWNVFAFISPLKTVTFISLYKRLNVCFVNERNLRFHQFWYKVSFDMTSLNSISVCLSWLDYVRNKYRRNLETFQYNYERPIIIPFLTNLQYFKHRSLFETSRYINLLLLPRSAFTKWICRDHTNVHAILHDCSM